MSPKNRVSEKSAPPTTVRVLVAASYVAVCASLTGGAPPAGRNCVHAGAPPRPFAFDSTHVSLSTARSPRPPKTINRLWAASYAPPYWISPRTGGKVGGASRVQVGGPPSPLAFVRTQVSLSFAQASLPAKT